jgi:IS1 family transposase
VISLSLLFSVNKYWIWLAIDFGPREIVGVFIGKRDRCAWFVEFSATGLSANEVTSEARSCAVCYTDFWEAYHEIFPPKRHRPVSKRSNQSYRTL